jgi:hypothetical protein
MTDELKLTQQVSRKHQAENLLKNELLNSAFDEIESTLMDSWKNSLAEDDTARNNAYLMYRLLQNLKSQFTRYVETGKMAERQLLEVRKRQK